jgi:hypothetical protein
MHVVVTTTTTCTKRSTTGWPGTPTDHPAPHPHLEAMAKLGEGVLPNHQPSGDPAQHLHERRPARRDWQLLLAAKGYRVFGTALLAFLG